MTEYSNVLDILNIKGTNRVFTVINFLNGKKYDIDSSNVINFYKSYCESLFVKDLKKWNVHPIFLLGEVTESSIPIIGEFKFKFDICTKLGSDEETPLYEKDLINGIINVYQETMKDLFFLSTRKTEMLCVVLESPSWREGNHVYAKLRFQFPYCKTDKKFCNGIFRTKIIQKLRQSKLLNLFCHSSPIGDWDSHLEEIKEFYPFYGSSDNSKRPPLYYMGAYKEKGEEVGLEKTYEYNKHQFISSEKCVKDQIEELEDEDMDLQDHKMYLLPIFLSMEFCSGITQIKEEFNSGQCRVTSSTACSEEDEDDYNENPDDFEICLQLIELLSIKRFKTEPYFLDIGKALYNACDGEQEGLNEWIRLSNLKKTGFDENYCQMKYLNFDIEEITVKTLAWYANEDSKEEYQIWHERWFKPKLLKAVDNIKLDSVVAEAFYRVFWLQYMHTGKKWVEFRRSKLVVLSEDINIRKIISQKFIPCFERLRAQISEEKMKLYKTTARNKDDKELKKLEAIIQSTGKLIDELHKERYRSTLVKSMREYFFKENLTKTLNKNPSILGCNNCVIELTDTEAFQRSGKPEDYITKKLGVNYQSTYNSRHPDVIALLKYFEQVFPEKSINHHMRKDIASMLYGRNAEKYFRMWIGDTNGSKSVYQKMLRTMLGDYYCDLPATYFSAQQRGGSGPNPELAQMEGSRVAFSAEPDDDTSFKGARIKRLTGGDSFYARSCNEDGGTIETSFKTVMVLNLVPDITGMDEATKNRFCMIPFEGRWIRKGENFHVEETHEAQVKAKTYWMDERFEDNIPKLASALLWLAVKYYKNYRKEGLTPPKYIKDWMTDYWKKHDPHISFITEMLENPTILVDCDECDPDDIDNEEECCKCKGKKQMEIIDMTKSITASQIYPIYKKWFRETYPQIPVVPKPRMVEILSTPDKLKKQKDRRWYGITIRKQTPVEISDF
jgi:phage/plasmid-associated DNA primase